MDPHKFLIGQHVYYKGTAGAPSCVYVVVSRLPRHEDGEFEYRIKHSCDFRQVIGKERELKVPARRGISRDANSYRGPPMTLQSVRARGVRSLWVVCELCHHEAVIMWTAMATRCRWLRSGRAWPARCAASSTLSPDRTGRSGR